MEAISKTILDKLSGLLFFLKSSKNEFEMVADEIENHSLKKALNNLSEESHYYAGELKYYLTKLGVSNASIASEPLQSSFPNTFDDDILHENSADRNELDVICAYNESNLVHAYSELLNETLPLQSLKEIIMYQLNALTISFLKIRTLNTARFAMY